MIFPGGDGWVYSFEPKTGELLWKFDCNPKDAVYKLGGRGTANDFVATPVIYDDKLYISVGQDPEHDTPSAVSPRRRLSLLWTGTVSFYNMAATMSLEAVVHSHCMYACSCSGLAVSVPVSGHPDWSDHGQPHSGGQGLEKRGQSHTAYRTT